MDEENTLTDQEICVLKLLAKGFTNKELAQGLNISVATTKAHLESIFKKLNAHNRVQAVVAGISAKYIEV